MFIKLFKMALSIFLVLCITENIGSVRAIGNQALNFRAFDTHSTGIPPQEEAIIGALLPNVYFNEYDFPIYSVTPTIDDRTGRMIGVSISSRFFHGPDIETLCSDLLMEQFMKNNGLQDVISVKIFDKVSFIGGFFARIETKNGIYFAIFMSGYDEYNWLLNQRIFTAEEFYKLCISSDVKVIVNDVEVSCATPLTMNFGSTRIPLVPVLEALGFNVRWDDESETLIFVRGNDTYEYYFKTGSGDISLRNKIYKNGKMWRDVMATPGSGPGAGITNGVIMVPIDFPFPDAYGICDAISHTVTIKTMNQDVPALVNLPSLSSWAEAEVKSLNARGAIPSALQNGYSYLGQATFQTLIRRDEFTALMVNVYELVKGEVSTYHSPFSDIADSDYKTEIEKAKTVGLIDGTSATGFTPSGLITREQAAKILCNLVSKIEETDPKPKGSPNYLDSAMISDWAAGFVAYAQENKIMTGSSTGRFYPLNNLSREEAMLVAERLIVQYGWDD
jgi:hypothetical protein